MTDISAVGSGPARARGAGIFAIGIALGVLVTLAAISIPGLYRSQSGPGSVVIGSVWVNYTYATPTPANDSQPVSELFYGIISGRLAGSQYGIPMSPYDNSTANCTLWSFAVFSPFTLISVTVIDLPNSPETVHEPLPVTLPAAIHGTSHPANFQVVIALPKAPGTYALVIEGTASCDTST